MKRMVSLLLVPLAIAPAVLAMVFAGEPRQTHVTAPPPLPLAFSQYMVNLGKVEAEKYISAFFRFRNNSRRSVVIDKLESSCGCLKPKLFQKKFRPDEVGEFYMRVDTALRKPGPQEFTCLVKYHEIAKKEGETETKHEQVVTFRMELPDQKVSVRPKALIVYQFNPEPTKQRFVVHDWRENSTMKVLSVSSDRTWVTAKLEPAKSDGEGGRQFPVEVTVKGDVPSGLNWAKITVQTDDPRFPKLQIPLRVHGPHPVPLK